jgi:type IV pilus biogenesis protein CpaD/CtpE
MYSRSISIVETGLNAKMRQVLLVLTALSALSLGACAKMDMPTTVTQSPIELSTEAYSKSYSVSGLSSADFDQMANRFKSEGYGHPEVIVGYDPYSKKNTAMKANDQLARIKTELSKRGLKDVKGSTLAIDHSGDQSEMVIGYESITAQVNDCDVMPGYKTGYTEANFDYKLGCTLNTVTAKQVAHPADLAGRAVDTVDGDGRRAGAVVEPYRTGEPNSQLSGAYTTQ